MPFTPYHFGPSGFVGLIFRKWIDIPVFIAANVIIDIEVLIWDRLPVHRYLHSLIFGTILGIVFALAAYPFRKIFARIMEIIHLPYKTSLLKKIFSGILGVWLHIIIDAFCHVDLRLFWPKWYRPLYRLLTVQQIKGICLIFWAAAIILYAVILILSLKRKKTNKVSHQA